MPPKNFATNIIDPSLGITDPEILASLKRCGALFDIDDVLDVEERWWTKFSTWEFDREKLYRDIITYLETNRLSLCVCCSSSAQCWLPASKTNLSMQY